MRDSSVANTSQSEKVCGLFESRAIDALIRLGPDKLQKRADPNLVTAS